jgi:salicylate hydroxylase
MNTSPTKGDDKLYGNKRHDFVTIVLGSAVSFDMSTNMHTNGVKHAVQHIPSPTHPTQSLQFLQKLHPHTQKQDVPPVQAKVKLEIIAVGAGLGGLACAIALARRGHSVTVLEQATQLGEVSFESTVSIAKKLIIARSVLGFRFLQILHGF